MGGFNGGGAGGVDFGTGSISFNFIPGDTLFATGPPEICLFNGGQALLGWISGQITAGPGLDTQLCEFQGYGRAVTFFTKRPVSFLNSEARPMSSKWYSS